MRLLYNILFPVLFLLAAPFYFWKLVRRGQWRAGFGQRFGNYGVLAAQLKDQRVIWLHAVSVGEANLAVQLVERLQAADSDSVYVVSTTTTTGMGVLERRLPAAARAIYYPIDWLPFVKRAFNALNPAAVVLVEAEIWPNLFWEAAARSVPMTLVNARLSERSFRGYQRFGFLFRPLFQSLCAAGVHHEADASRLEALGTRPEVISVTGNLKFDFALGGNSSTCDARGILNRLDVPATAPVLVAGSTFEGEELLLADLLPRWRTVAPDLFLVIVPRHFERGAAVREQLQTAGWKVACRTELDKAPAQPDVLLVDSTGELTAFYETALLVFVGKSLTAQGGQNPIEPAALGRPLVFGPFMQNFRAVVRELLQAKAARQVQDEVDLAETVGFLLENPTEREALGKAARGVVEANKGATQRTADMLGQSLRALS